MNPAGVCSVCQQGGHRMDRCPELCKDLQPGFYRPSGNAPQGGGGDDDDESLNKLWSFFRSEWNRMTSIYPSKNA